MTRRFDLFPPLRTAIFLVIMVCVSWVHAGNDPFTIRLNLSESDSFQLKVDIKTPHIDLDKVRFVLPSNVPGCISELKTGNLISRLKAYDSDGKELKILRASLNEFDIFPAQKLNRIEYIMHDSWHYDDPAVLMRQLGTSFVHDRHFMINFHALVGYLEGYESNPFRLEIQHPDSMYGHSAIGLGRARGVDTATATSYLALLDNPVMYNRERETGYIVGKTHYHLCLWSERDSVKVRDISKVMQSVCEGADAFCNGFNVKDYYFLINFADASRNGVRKEDEYGAVEHSGSSVYYFAESNNRLKVVRDLQLTASHELFHLFEPINMKTDMTSKLNLRAKMQTGNLWIYEGFTEYFSLLMQYRKELLTEQEFITEVRNKISLAQFYEPYSLTDQSEKCYLEGNERGYQNFYYKGAVIAMMLDLRIMKLSKGEQTLESVMTDMKNNTRSNYVVKDESVITEMVKYSYPEVQDFFDKYVKDTLKPDYNEYLSTLGWKYEAQRIDTERLFVNAQYRYTKASKEYYVTNITLDQIGMREGDVLVAINGKPVTKENFQSMLEKYSDKNNSKDVIFTVKRAGQEMDLTGPPLTITRSQKNIIAVEKKADTEKKTFRKRYSSGSLHKNKMYK